MKILIIILILTLILSLNVYSQNDSSNKLSDSMDLKQHSIYFEGGGNTLSISLNYEYTAFNKLYISDSIMTNLSFRVGTTITSIFIGP